jgi:hypothetical protein
MLRARSLRPGLVKHKGVAEVAVSGFFFCPAGSLLPPEFPVEKNSFLT